MRFAKLQSAMEYLMTYGWSILLIAIVIAAIFELGVFNNNPLTSSNTCLAQSGFLCTKPQLNATGVLNVTFGQSYGTTYTITGVACTNSTAGAPSSFVSIGSIPYYTGQPKQLTFQCPLTSGVIGTSFSGVLWIQYNTATLSGQTAKIGIVNAKVTTSNPQGISSYTTLLSVPMTLTNLQAVATGSNFQQMLVINSNQYSSYINGNWMNVEFTTGNAAAGTPGAPLQAWIEANASNISPHTIIWVNLPSGIPATSSSTIYMDILASNILSASGPTGEAPQLSSTYAQYDNGASVFSFYDNFAGSTLSANWQVTNGGNAIVNNGLSFTPTNAPSSGSSLLSVSGSIGTSSSTFDLYGYMGYRPPSTGYTYVDMGFESQYDILCDPSTGSGGTNLYTLAISSACSASPNTNYPENTMGQNQIYTIMRSGSTEYSEFNYGSENSLSTTGTSASTIGISEQTNARAAFVQWIRLRVTPPNAILPTQSNNIVIPSQILYYVPITFTNLQSVATTNNFQANVIFSAGAYQAYEANTLQNIEFFYSNGTVVPSWMEGNVLNEQQTTNLYTSNMIMYWLKISPQIAASGGTQIVYLGFAANTINLLNTGTTGEAPQLSSTYAQYDNGAVVFPYYSAWGGLSSNSLPSGWSSSSISNIQNYPTNTVISSGYPQSYMWINSPKSANTFPTVMEMYGDMDNGQTSGGNEEIFGLTANHGSPWNYLGYALCTGLTNSYGVDLCYDGTPSAGAQYSNFIYSTPTASQVYSLLIPNSTSISGLDNYGSLHTLPAIATLNTTYFEIVGDYFAQYPVSVSWLRTRSYPPSGVMPSISFGSFA